MRTTLQFINNGLLCEHGFYYHFVDMSTGQRWRKCELSSVDTSLLLCGALTARQYFDDWEIQDLAAKIYNRVDWPWMLNKGYAFSMGWRPEAGFISSRWDHYGEMMMIYLLGIGSPTYPVSPETWKAFSRPKVTYDGITYITGKDPLFYAPVFACMFDFRNKEDAYTNYFENSILATKAHKQFCLSMKAKFGHCCDDCGALRRLIHRRATRHGADLQYWGILMGASFPAQPADRFRFCMRIACRYYGRSGGNIRRRLGDGMDLWTRSILLPDGMTLTCWELMWASRC